MREQELWAETEAEATEKLLTGLLLLLLSAYCLIYLRSTCRETLPTVDQALRHPLLIKNGPQVKSNGSTSFILTIPSSQMTEKAWG